MISLLSPLNIGYRHILPVLFVIYLLLGACVTQKTLSVKVLCAILLFFQAMNTIVASPYLLGWFNVISGGQDDGWRYLADSNTDWGQGYKALAQYQQTHNLPPVQLAGFVFYDPAIYDLNYTPLPPLHGDTPAIFPSRFAPMPGHYAISLTSLDGIPLADNEMYDWFRWHLPQDRIANAINYYAIEPEDTATYWIAQCTNPVPPLNDSDISFGFGDREQRRYIPFDCTQTWVIPSQHAGSGAYVLHGIHLANTLLSNLHYAEPRAEDPFIHDKLTTLEMSYQQRQYRDNPAFGIYRSQSSASTSGIETQVVWIAPAESPPLDPEDRIDTMTPVELMGPLNFLRVQHRIINGVLEVETWWKVTGRIENAKTLSIMAHVLNEAGENIGIADGLGITADVWSPGDIIIQRHRFPLDNGAIDRAIYFRTGLYWLPDGDRLPIIPGDGADAIYIKLEQ